MIQNSRLRGRSAALLAICLLASAAHGQTFWEPLGGPYGGSTLDIAVHPETGRVLVAIGWAHNIGGSLNAGAIYVSDDRGGTWRRATEEEFETLPDPRTRPRSIAFDAASGDVFASLDGGGGVWRSADGEAWSSISTGLPGATGSSIRSVAVDAPGGRLYAACANDLVYASVDAGASWFPDAAGLPQTLCRTVVMSGGAAVLCTGAGVFTRTLPGPWVGANNGLTTLSVNRLRVGGDGLLYACTDAGVFASPADASAWQGVGGAFSSSIAWDVLATATARLVTTNDGVYRSASGGPWQLSNDGLGDFPARSLAQDPLGRVYLAAADAGVYISDDQGLTWTRSVEGIDGHAVRRLLIADDGLIVAGTRRNGFHRSVDGGATFEPPDLPEFFAFALEQSPWGDLFAGNYNITGGISDGHAWRSTDDGDTWTPLDTGLPAAMVSGFVFGAAHEVWVSSSWNPGGVAHSATNGDSWSRIGPPQNIPAYCLGRGPSGDFFFGTEGRGVWRYRPAAGDWSNRGLTQSQQFAVAFDSGGRIFIGNDGNIAGLWMSQDGGDTFVPVNSLPGQHVYAIAVLPDDSVYAGTRDYGIHRSFDHGQTWEAINDGVSTTCCYAIELGPDGHLYAGVSGGPVFRSRDRAIPCLGDFNDDGVRDTADFFEFVSGFFGAPPEADYNRDGVTDTGDFFEFIADFFGPACA